MWHTIAEEKNKYAGKESIIVGPGPTADDIDMLVESYEKKPVLISLNRAIVLRNDYSYLVVDHPATIDIVSKFTGRAKKICMPITSRGNCNINFETAINLQDRILLFAMAYEVDEILTAPEYPLNDFLLYIAWGSAQIALHFAKKIGVSDVTMIGCDGGPIDGRIMAKKIEDIFGMFRKRNEQKRNKAYKKTHSRLLEIAKKLGMKLEFYQK